MFNAVAEPRRRQLLDLLRDGERPVNDLVDLTGLTQPQVSKLELGGTVPTLPLLARLAGALDASLNIALDGDTSSVAFIPHAA